MSAIIAGSRRAHDAAGPSEAAERIVESRGLEVGYLSVESHRPGAEGPESKQKAA